MVVKRLVPGAFSCIVTLLLYFNGSRVSSQRRCPVKNACKNLVTNKSGDNVVETGVWIPFHQTNFLKQPTSRFSLSMDFALNISISLIEPYSALINHWYDGSLGVFCGALSFHDVPATARVRNLTFA